MVEVTITSRAKNFIPLALLRHIAASSEAPHEVNYIGIEGVTAIKGEHVRPDLHSKKNTGSAFGLYANYGTCSVLCVCLQQWPS